MIDLSEDDDISDALPGLELAESLTRSLAHSPEKPEEAFEPTSNLQSVSSAFSPHEITINFIIAPRPHSIDLILKNNIAQLQGMLAIIPCHLH